MSYLLKQSSTAKKLMFLMVQSSDHVTALTGASPTVTLSKAGAAFGSPAGAVTELANGWYVVAGNATDTNTLGPLVLHATATSGDPVDVVYTVVAFDPDDSVRLGLTALPNAAAGANGGLPTGNASGQVVMSGTAADAITASSIATDALGALELAAGAATEIAAAVWDEARSSHIATGSFGQSLQLIRNSTAAGGAAGTITLDGSASATDDFYNDCIIFILSGLGASQARLISDYVGSTKVASVTPNWVTNPDATSVFVVIPAGRVDVGQWLAAAPNALTSGRVDSIVGAYASGQAPLQPTTAGRTLDVTATGEAGIDWANIGAPTTVVTLSGTTVKTATDVETDTQDIQSRLPAALVSGRIDASAGALASGVIVAGSFTAGAIDAAAIATDAIGALELAAGADTEIAAAVWDAALTGITTAGSIGKLLKDDIDATISSRNSTTPPTVGAIRAEMDSNSTKLAHLDADISTRLASASYTAPPSAATNADAIWDEARAGHVGAGSFGEGVIVNTNNDKTGYGLSTLESMVLHSGTAQDGHSGSLTLAAGASSDTDTYKGAMLKVYSGAGAGQVRVITAYDGSSKIASVDRDWAVTVDSSSVYAVLAVEGADLSDSLNVIADSVTGNVGGDLVGNVQGNVLGTVASAEALGSQAQVDVRTQVNTSLNTAVPGSPTANSINERVKTLDDNYTATRAPLLDHLDADVSSRLATSGYTAPDNATIAAIAGYVDTEVAAIKAKTDNLPASPAAVSDIPTAAQNASTVWDKALTGITTAGSIGKLLKDDIDATVSSRLPSGSYSAPPSAASISDAVWDETMVDHLAAGTTGASLNGAGSAGDPWTTALPGAYGAGTAGYIVGTDLDATVSSRNATTPPTVAAIRSEMDTNSTKLAHLDVDTSTRLATSGYTAPPSSADNADAIWDEARSGHTGAGTFGQGVASVQGNVTGSAASVTGAVGSVTGSVGGNVVGSVGSVTADVSVGTNNDKTGYGLSSGERTTLVSAIWDKLLMGITTVGSIGKLIKDNLDAAISSRLSTGGYTAPDNADILLIKAKTNNLPSDPADASDIAASFATVNTKLDAIDDYIDTEVASIKGVTDHLATAIELDGSVYRFTINALEQAPSGGGASDPLLNVVPGAYASGSAGYALGQIAAIKSKTDSIGSVRMSVSSWMDEANGNIRVKRGDAYTIGSVWGPFVWLETTGMWLPFVGKDATFTAKRRGQADLTKSVQIAIVSGNDVSITLELESDDTSIYDTHEALGVWLFDVQVSMAPDEDTTPLEGVMHLLLDITPPTP